MSLNNKKPQKIQWLTHFGTLELDIQKDQLSWSEAACRIFEIEAESAPSTYLSMLACIHPDDRERVKLAHKDYLSKPASYDIEYRLLFDKGRIKYVHEYCENQFDENNTPLQSVATVYDISHHREAEQALQESEQRFQRLAELSPVGIFRTDAKGRCLYVNNSWCQMAGIDIQKAMGEGWSAALHPDDHQRVFNEWQQAADNKQMPFRTECRFQRPDGIVTWILCQADAEYNNNNEITGYVGTITNISNSKDTETALRQIAETVSGIADDQFFNLITRKLTRLFQVDYAFIGLFDKQDPVKIETLSLCVKGDIQGNISYNLQGSPCEHVVDKQTCIHPSGVSKEFPDNRMLVDMGIDSYIGTPLFDPSGTPLGVVVLLHSQPLQQIECIQPVMEIVAARVAAELERQQAEKALLKSTELLQAVFEASPDMIVIHSAEGPILDANRNALEAYGLNKKEMLEASIEELSAPGYSLEMADEHLQRAFRGKPEDFEWMAKNATGNEFPVEVRLRRLNEKPAPGEAAIVAVVRDISQQKKTDEAFSALSMGVMGNQFNNYLQHIMQNLTRVFNAQYAFIGRLIEPHNTHVKTLSIWADNAPVDNCTYALKGTPCDDILCLNAEVIPQNVCQLYPEDELLVQMGAESYYGLPLINSHGRVLGLVAIMDSKPMQLEPWSKPVLKVFATRLANEIERHEAIQALKFNEAHLEQLVEDRTRELKNINKELETFSYSVSHDLRAPLRTIDGFSQLLQDDYSQALDKTAIDYLQRIQGGGQRMGEIIENLLQLSSASRNELQLTSCNLSKLAENTIAQLREQHPERQIELLITENMKANADEKLLAIVVDNLLGNAWKYTSKNTHTHIEFNMSKNGAETVFQIKDNGAGFDMRYADKLFTAFQRLHGSEFEGTGIGLATVQRIIHRHGGKIWAEAEVNKGACFYFTLPDTEAPKAETPEK